MKTFYLLTSDEMNQFEIQGLSLADALENGMTLSLLSAVDEYGAVSSENGWYIEEIKG